MVSLEQANYSINIGIHVLILFTFLTLFFFLIISKKENESVDRAFSNIINQKVNSLLDKVDGWDKKIKEFSINWSEVNKVSDNIINNSQGEDPEITKNNKKLRFLAVGMVGSLILLLILLYLYYTFIKKYKINLGHILAENAIIFVFVGAIEYTFFVNIASKYVPESPDYITTSILDRIKQLSTEYILKKN